MLPRLSNLLLSISLLILSTMGVTVYAQELDIQNIDLPVKVVQPPLAVNLTEHPGKELVVIGVDENAQRTLVILVQDECCNGWKVLDQTPLARSWITFDFGEREDGAIESLYFLDRKSVHRYQPGEEENFQFVQEVRSTYLLDDVDFIHRTEFVYDLNKDSKDDFVLTGFESFNIWLSDGSGELRSQFLPIASVSSVYSGRANGHIRFRRPNVVIIDANNDDKEDVIHVNDGYLSLYLQDDAGFSTKAQNVTTSEQLNASQWWLEDEEDGRQRSRGDLSYRYTMSVSDINGDEVPDIIAMHTTASSVLSQKDNLEFYFGKMIEGKLRYETEPSSVISYAETINDIDFTDLDDDGSQEVRISSLKLGLRKIVAALFSGSVGQDVFVFRLNAQGVYENSPVAKEKVKLSFSFSEGTTGDPLNQLLDFDGDGIKDLVLSDGDDAFNVVKGKKGQGVSFETSGTQYEFTLPTDSFNVAIDDVDLDGKEDMVFYYGRSDPSKLRNRIAIVKGK